MKVYINKHKRDSRTGSLKVVGREIVEADLIQKRKHSVLVRLPDGNIIIRKVPKDIPNETGKT